MAPSSTTELMDTTEQTNANGDDDRLTLNNVIFAGSGHSKCVICRQETRRGMISMPKSARLDLLIIHLMYAPNGVRCCPSHLLNNNRLLPDVEISMGNRQQLAASLLSSEMIDLVTDLLSLLHEAVTSPRLDFLDPSLNDEDYLTWTGWTKAQFDNMFDIISPYLRSSSNRNTRNALAMFWIKLKTNLSFRQIGSVFNIPGNSEDRRKRAADAFDSVRQCLIEKFVPRHLGVQHLAREDAKKQNTSFSIEFFGNNVTIIWDGTYLYMGKSSSHLINRKTYSGQKHRHLIKFMSLILPNGYVLDTIGPFWGTMNDASIAKNITDTCDILMKWCEKGDTMIVDRGFRDVIESFIDMGYEARMPDFLTKGQKQHTVEQANRSRLITKVRWRIESYHARMKKWALLSGRIENAFIPKVADCVRIVSAALNCYRGQIGQHAINSDDSMLAQYMRQQIGRNNILQARVDQGL
ncbi:unnamed protein product [Rotaria sp. Silwood2]|nr:unnamed protein product [Rotaria sp. Silwood2]